MMNEKGVGEERRIKGQGGTGFPFFIPVQNLTALFALGV